MEVLLSSTCDVLMLEIPEPGKWKPRARVLSCKEGNEGNDTTFRWETLHVLTWDRVRWDEI